MAVRRIIAAEEAPLDAPIARLVAAALSRPSRSERAREGNRIVLQGCVDYLKRRGVRRIGDLTRALAVAWVEKLCERGVKKSTIDSYVKLASLAWRACRPRDPDPFAGIKVEAMEGETVVHKVPFTTVEVGKIVALCRERRDEVSAFACIGLCTGLRRGDICNLRWDAFDFASCVVSVATHKTGAVVEIPILPLLGEALSWMPRKGEFVLPLLHRIYNAPHGHGSGVTLRVQNLITTALTGVVPSRRIDCLRRKGGGIAAARRALCNCGRVGGRFRGNIYGCHSLRTTFVTLAINGGIPAEKLIAITGHGTVKMIRRNYFRPTGADLRDALAAALPDILSRRAAGTAQTPAGRTGGAPLLQPGEKK